MWSLCALILGFCLDLLIGDPHGIPHPVVYIGKLIDVTEKGMRKMFPKTVRGENFAGAAVWLIVVTVSAGIPLLVLHLAYGANCWLGLLLETILCAQILATKSLKTESMKVYQALQTGDLSKARYAVSMIVGRDTQYLDEAGVARAAVETVAENTSDGIIAPMLFLAIGGAPLGFFYKAVNTMDSMLGYVEMPYKNIGLVSAKMDDVLNFLPARLSALVMLLSGALLGLDGKNGWKIFWRDRYNHASPNSAQTESVCAGLLGLRLGGDAWYHGVLHKKQYIGDPCREIVPEDIPLACRLLYLTALLALVLCAGGKMLAVCLLC